jgi:TP901 family phage tail tape measure protein
MADENIVTNIVAKSDFSNLISDLNKVSFSLTKLQDQLVATNKTLAAQVGVMNRSFADTLRSTGQYSTHFVSLTSDVDKFGMQLERGQLKLGKFFQVYNQHAKTNGGLIRDLAKQQVQLQSAILQPLGKNAEGLMQYNVHIPKGLDLVKNKAAIAKQELMIMNKVVQEGANQLINWGKNTQWAGRQLTVGLTVPLAAFGKASADAFRQADEQLVRLTKVYGGVAQVSSQELGKVREDVSRTAADLAKSYGASFKDTLALAADIAATGKEGNDLLGAIKETTRLSVLGEVDRQEAMKATLAIQTAFKQNTDELSESINFLNAVENQTSTTLNDLVEAIPKAGPIIRGLGGSVQDLALYLTAMREGGINATEGANALKSALASLINPTNVAVKKFQGFGIDLLGIVSTNAGNVTATLLELQAALDKLDPLQKQQAIEQLFGKFQFSRLNALFENLGKQGSQTLQVLDLMKASSEDLGNLASRELSQVTESASGKYRRAVEGLKADLAGIGEQFLTINTSLINFVDGIIKFVQKLPEPIKQALGFMGMLTAAAGPLIMLTGVLGNFFGYIIKGAYHFKSLFKGGEGWKLLTPEILAAQKAGNLVEQTFYSDAKAAAVLKQAIAGLTAEFTLLQQRASSAAMAVNPGISTVAGSTIIAGRAVNPNSPYLGPEGSRSAGHHISRSTMTTAQRDAQTIHSFTPIPLPLNKKVGTAPMVFAEGDLPKIEGLTASRGVSTGIVAGEAAKWHTLMGTLSMMTKREVRDLKKEIARTGTFSTEINTTFGQLLPAMTSLTSNAAAESALIVQQLQAGKLTVDAARAKIIAINSQLEAMMAQTTTQVATSLGRTANLTQVPLLNQPIVGPTGKANTKEIFRANRPGAQIIDKIARALGVRTWGGGYSTETTMPKRMNMGGYVYTANDGSIVPGPNINADVVPAVLTPGEFVVNREATQANLPLLTALNNNRGSDGPGFNLGTRKAVLATTQQMYSGRQISHLGRSFRSVDRPDLHPELMSQYGVSSENLMNPRTSVHGGLVAAYHTFFNQGTHRGSLPIDVAINYLRGIPVPINSNGLYAPNGTQNVTHDPLVAYGPLMEDLGIRDRSKLDFVSNLDREIINTLTGQKESGKTILADRITGRNANQRVSASILRNAVYRAAIPYGSSVMRGLRKLEKHQEVRVPQGVPATGKPTNRGLSTNRIFRPTESRASSAISALRAGRGIPQFTGSAFRFLSKAMGRNSGGMIPGYNMGGMVQGYNRGGGPVSAFTAGVRNPYGKSIVSGGMPQMGMGSQMAIGMGGTMAGSMIGGPAGMAVMAASNILPLMSGLKGIGGVLPMVTKLAGVLGRLTIPGAVIGGAFMLGRALLDLKKNYEDVGKANRLAFGGTQESFASVGITKFKTLSDRLKEVNEQIELNKAKAQSAYEAYTKGGPTGITLSITELNEAIENAKKNQTDYIEAFNSIDSSGVNKYAADLKAQFVAMGLSASEASNQIFAIVKASDKARQALSAVTTTDFRNIIDQTTALTRLFDNLGRASTINNFNPEEFAQGLDTLVNSVIAYQEGLIGTKDALDPKNIIDSAESLRITMEKITKINSSNSILSVKQVENLKQQNVIYASILGNLESTASITAKILLYNNELAEMVNLSAMSGPEAISMAQNYAEILNGVNSITEDLSNNNPLKALAEPINKAKNASTDYAKTIKAAQKQDQDYYSNKIKAIDLEIKKIREAADARRKALQEQQDAESYTSEIKKLQLEYQNALAAGDMSRAAQAQINLQQLTKEKQTRDAIAAITKKEEEDIKKKEAEKQRIQDAESKFKKGVEIATAKSAEEAASVANLEKNLKRLKELSVFYAADTSSKARQDFAKEAQGIIFAMKSGTREEQKAATDLEKQYSLPGAKPQSLNVYGAPTVAQETLNLYGAAQASTGQKVLDAMNKEMERKGVSDTLFRNAVTDFRTAVDKFKNIPGTGSKESPINIRGTYNTGSAQTDGRLYAPDLIKENALKANQYINYQGKDYRVSVNDYIIPVKKAMGGQIRNYQMGSFGGITGPGTGTSDSIPAMLSNGEYVLRASAVKAVGVPMLDEINRMAMGGLATRYDVGKKMIMPSNTMGYNKGGTIQHYNVGGLVMNFENGGQVDGRMLFEQFKSAMALEQLKSGGGGKLR